MPAPTSITDSAAINAALDQEFIENFRGEYDRLAEVLGIFSPEVMRAGQALNMIKIDGSLNDAKADDSSSGTAYVEGDEVGLSKYEAKKVPVGEITIEPYRKLTTAQAIMKSGYDVAMLRTDNKMLSHVRVATLKKFFDFMAKGTGTPSTGTVIKSLQASLAYGDAALQDSLEENGDESNDFVHFINRQDAAKYLAEATITTQTMYGMTYIEDFLGVRKVFVTSQVPAGTTYVTPTDNIHIFGLDFSSIAQGGLAYATESNGLIGVAHTPAYDRVSAETHVINGMLLFPEVTDYIVKSTVTPTA